MAALIIKAIGVIAAAASSKILADEFKAWRPWLTRWLVEFAARRVPAEQRDRYGEEWSSYVEETPGEVGRILAALGLLWAAAQIGLASRKDRQKGGDAIKDRVGGRRAAFADLLHKVLAFADRFQSEIFIVVSALQVGSIVKTLWRSHWSLQAVRLNGSLRHLIIEVGTLMLLLATQLWLTRERRARAAAYATILRSLSEAARLAVEMNAKFHASRGRLNLAESRSLSHEDRGVENRRRVQ